MINRINNYKETGQMCEILYAHTDKLIRSALHSKYLLMIRTKEDLEDMIQCAWIKVVTNIAKYDGSYKWSTYVYNSVKYAMQRDYTHIRNTIVLPQQANNILSKYKSTVGVGRLTHDEFLNNLIDGDYGSGYNNKVALDNILRSTSLQPSLGKVIKEGKEIDPLEKYKGVTYNVESLIIYNVLRDTARDHIRSLFKKKRALVLEHRVLPLIFEDHGALIEYKALSSKIDLAISSIVRNHQSIMKIIKNDKKAMSLLKEYISYRRAM